MSDCVGQMPKRPLRLIDLDDAPRNGLEPAASQRNDEQEDGPGSEVGVAGVQVAIGTRRQGIIQSLENPANSAGQAGIRHGMEPWTLHVIPKQLQLALELEDRAELIP